MNVLIKVEDEDFMPSYATEYSAGADLRARVESDVILAPGQSVLIPTGVYIEIPQNYEAQVRPRSGLALKKGITVLNSPGTIDADYRGEIQVILVNLSSEKFVVQHGERIAQLIVASHETVNWESVEFLEDSVRGEGGFGHTGKH